MATDEVYKEYENCLISASDFDKMIEIIEINNETQQHFFDAVNEVSLVNMEQCFKCSFVYSHVSRRSELNIMCFGILEVF